jgi:GNAT superfamily N-acetyltransferase
LGGEFAEAKVIAMSIQHLPRLATTDEVDALSSLFCSARREIRLAESVCSAEEREKLLRWFRQKCEASSLWTTDGRNALVILGRSLFDIIEEVEYVVVSENLRGQGIASSIIQHVQSLECVRSLRAEARNERSRTMLRRCGFFETGETRSDNPWMRWERE